MLIGLALLAMWVGDPHREVNVVASGFAALMLVAVYFETRLRDFGLRGPAWVVGSMFVWLTLFAAGQISSLAASVLLALSAVVAIPLYESGRRFRQRTSGTQGARSLARTVAAAPEAAYPPSTQFLGRYRRVLGFLPLDPRTLRPDVCSAVELLPPAEKEWVLGCMNRWTRALDELEPSEKVLRVAPAVASGGRGYLLVSDTWLRFSGDGGNLSVRLDCAPPTAICLSRDRRLTIGAGRGASELELGQFARDAVDPVLDLLLGPQPHRA